LSEVVKYDPESDILLVRIREGEVTDEQLLDNDVVLGLDSEGNVLYVEVWRASRRGLLGVLASLARTKSRKLEALLKSASKT